MHDWLILMHFPPKITEMAGQSNIGLRRDPKRGMAGMRLAPAVFNYAEADRSLVTEVGLPKRLGAVCRIVFEEIFRRFL
jgi:hypothetical protein